MQGLGPQGEARAQQPDGQTEGHPAKGGVISPGSASWSANFKHPIPNIWPYFFYFLPQSRSSSNAGSWLGCSWLFCRVRVAAHPGRGPSGGKAWWGWGGEGGRWALCQSWDGSWVWGVRANERTEGQTHDRQTWSRQSGQREQDPASSLSSWALVTPSTFVITLTSLDREGPCPCLSPKG